MKNWNPHQYSSNSLLKQQVNQMARTADQCQSCVNSWPFVYDDDGIIKYLLCAWMWPARVYKASTRPRSVHSSRGGRPWIELSENDKSVPLGPVFQLNMQNKMQISSYLRLSSKSAWLGFTGAIEKAETTSMKRLWNEKKLGKIK